MKAYGTSYLFNAKNLRKIENIEFLTKKLFLTLQILCQYFHKILNISENTEPISTNLVLNESL